jgi:hypothetical protein
MRAALFVAANGCFLRLPLLQRLSQLLAPTQGVNKLPSVRRAQHAEAFPRSVAQAVAREQERVLVGAGGALGAAGGVLTAGVEADPLARGEDPPPAFEDLDADWEGSFAGLRGVGEEAVARNDGLTDLAKAGLVLIESTEPITGAPARNGSARCLSWHAEEREELGFTLCAVAQALAVAREAVPARD